MEHTEAIETNASDRYVLRQLSAAETDAFEEHYFDCAECAEDVRLGMTIMEGGRRLVREGGAPVEAPMAAPGVPIDSRPRWNKWIPAAAAAALLTIPAHFVMLTRMQRAVAVPLFVIAKQHTSETRGASTEAPVTAGETATVQEGETTIVWIEVVAGRTYSRYELQVMRGTSILGKQALTPEQLKDALPFVPLGMSAGTYDLVIHGSDPKGRTAELVHRQKLVIVKAEQGSTQGGGNG